MPITIKNGPMPAKRKPRTGVKSQIAPRIRAPRNRLSTISFMSESLFVGLLVGISRASAGGLIGGRLIAGRLISVYVAFG
jgi:hypothetical protein